ncbi:PLP-dependent aminotransferase family protein [Bacillus taeanensis]|uniref:PLP-dependent aminotransferase family protein n=1 Tax=Bacillus taeanensis TaxID=273032 RepID=A0A366XNB0_9BACI|nr:PLP-dependent aminotransferase family protein [Bacillus taeanensis]RBW67612.1 PLP-dependent aminotransferase family protein [Bacillus taeanensis]
MKYAFAKRVQHLQSSAVRDILKVVNSGNVISFAGGLPDDDLFPVEAVEAAFSKTFQSGKKSFQYGLTEGYEPLREVLIERMGAKGIKAKLEEVMLTTGSQQAIDLFARIMFSPGDVVLTENPTYLAAVQVFQSYEVNIIPVESDEHGMIPEDLEYKMKKYMPKCVYVVPTFSNPSGKVWSLERRKLLLKLAKKKNVVIFEDDPYGELKFNPKETYTPIAALDNGKHVLYTSTFSKTVVPALRTGWIKGPYQIIRMMAQAKQAADLHSNSLAHHALYHLCCDFDLNRHIATLQKEYFNRMKIMQNLLDQADLPGLSYIEPKGGMFFWVRLPEEINATELLNTAVENGVAYVPGAPFYVSNPEQNTIRLNFTHSTPDKLEQGMKTLVNVFQNAIHLEKQEV